MQSIGYYLETLNQVGCWVAPLMRLTNDKRRACTAEQLMLE